MFVLWDCLQPSTWIATWDVHVRVEWNSLLDENYNEKHL